MDQIQLKVNLISGRQISHRMDLITEGEDFFLGVPGTKGEMRIPIDASELIQPAKPGGLWRCKREFEHQELKNVSRLA